ncbi:MAG: hypothetical protein LBJ63_00840 [Prevotellaceae bacterium]|jgi:hypothetical protein|nr:hypothetical protein [Prevotellaceae bacterium]
MKTNVRAYSCKDEELPIICGYAAHGLERDLSDFSAFSPMFNGYYLDQFKNKIATVEDLVNPHTETVARKIVTERLYGEMSGLLSPINRVESYVKLAGQSIPVSVTDFGIIPLRKKIDSGDAEGVIRALRLVITNIETYEDILSKLGLTDDLIQQLRDARAQIEADNEEQFNLLSDRKKLVQGNIDVMNDLYRQLSEFCEVGKTLYKGVDPEKVQEYTFAYLVKKVRNVHRHKSNAK